MLKLLKKVKRKINFLMQHSKYIQKRKYIYDFAYDLNHVLFHWNKRQHDKTFGTLNPEIKFFVIRGDNTDEGLLSMYLGNIRRIYQCLKNNIIPIVDYQNFKTQYNVDFEVNGTRNAWEYYFSQPCNYTLDEIYRSQNVKLSGWRFKNAPPLLGITTDNEIYDAMKIAPVKQYIIDIAQEKIKSDKINEMIGLLVRGTDYTKLRPAGHSIPPTPEMVYEKLEEFFAKHGTHKIFLATEDEEIYQFFRTKYKDLIYTTDRNFVRNYSGRDYIANEIYAKNKYEFGLDYLVKMICLSECKFLITSNTAGSRFARILNHGRYKEEYVFDLGRY